MSCTKPRILCLHGGGVSASIFELQLRYFTKTLSPDFRLVFANGPWPSEMHDDLKPIYSHLGPCYRWANWKPHHPYLEDGAAVHEIEHALMTAMDADNGEGEWVGLLGFSQGAAMVFSILLENQLRAEERPRRQGFAGVEWRFGVIMAGRAPPFSLGSGSRGTRYFKSVMQLPQGQAEKGVGVFADCDGPRLRTPTVHVHGLRDVGLELHRDLLECCVEPGHGRLVEWDGGHRIPLKSMDVRRVTEGILEVSRVRETPDRKGVFDYLSPECLVGNLHSQRPMT